MEGLEKAGGAPVQPPSRSGAVSRRDNPAKVGDPGLQQKLVDRSLSCLDLAGGGNRRINPLFPSTPRLRLGEHMPRLHKHSRTHGSLLVSKQQVRGFPVRSRESDRQAVRVRFGFGRTHTRKKNKVGIGPPIGAEGAGGSKIHGSQWDGLQQGRQAGAVPGSGSRRGGRLQGLFRLIRHTV